jgi:hypothetical protein
MLIVGFCGGAIAQTTIWSVDFNNGCTANCLANTYGGWSILNNDGGASGGSPNDWFVSCAEDGVTPPGCGNTCAGDASLHIGADPGGGGDNGATFNETGLVNATFKTAISPTVSTVGYTTNTLAFDFIAFGSSACADDRAQLRLSTDNGSTWPVGFQYCLTSVCCGACNGYSQGQWTTYTLALPAAFDNNPNVRIGFNWRNNGNGSGTDPSVAIDDVRITTIFLPVHLLSFQAREAGEQIKLSWTSTEENQLNRYEVERSSQPSGFKTIGSVPARLNLQTGQTNYAFSDAKPGSNTVYYRLKMVDNNGTANYSNIVRVVPGATEAAELVSFSPNSNDGTYEMNMWAVDALQADVEIRDLKGRLVHNVPDQNLVAGQNKLRVDLSEIASAPYLLTVRISKSPKGFEPVNITRKFVVAH